MPTTGCGAGRDQAAEGELADDAQAQHGGGAAEGDPGADGGAEAVAGDAGPGGFLGVEAGRQRPQLAAFVADRQQLGGGVVAGVTDAVARLPTLHVGADGRHDAGGAVAGLEGEFPVRQVRVLEPLMRAGVDGQLRAGADDAGLGADEDLVGRGVGQFDFTDGDGVRGGEDGLACVHGSLRRGARLIRWTESIYGLGAPPPVPQGRLSRQPRRRRATRTLRPPRISGTHWTLLPGGNSHSSMAGS